MDENNEDDDLFKITGMSLSKIIAVYEIIEKEIFLYVVDFISPEYKNMDVDDVTS